MNLIQSFNLVLSLIPGDNSTPEFKSIPAGFIFLRASPRFEKFKPPAKKKCYSKCPSIKSQSKDEPVPP